MTEPERPTRLRDLLGLLRGPFPSVLRAKSVGPLVDVVIGPSKNENKELLHWMVAKSLNPVVKLDGAPSGAALVLGRRLVELNRLVVTIGLWREAPTLEGHWFDPVDEGHVKCLNVDFFEEETFFPGVTVLAAAPEYLGIWSRAADGALYVAMNPRAVAFLVDTQSESWHLIEPALVSREAMRGLTRSQTTTEVNDASSS